MLHNRGQNINSSQNTRDQAVVKTVCPSWKIVSTQRGHYLDASDIGQIDHLQNGRKIRGQHHANLLDQFNDDLKGKCSALHKKMHRFNGIHGIRLRLASLISIFS